MVTLLEATNYVVVLTALTAFLMLLLRVSDAGKQLSRLLVVAFGIRVGYGTVDTAVGFLTGRYDFVKYDDSLWFVAQQWRKGDILAVFGIRQKSFIVYDIVFAPVYTLFGHQPLLVRLSMALVGTLFTWNLYRIAKLVWSRRAGMWAAGFGAVFPYWIYLSVIFYRDMLNLLVLSQFVFLLLLWSKRDGLGSEIVGVGVFALLAIALRKENIVPMAAALSVAAGDKFRKGEGRAAITTVVLLAAGFALSNKRVQNLLSKADLYHLQKRRELLARPGPEWSYLSELEYTTVVEFLLFLPLGAFYFLLVPFPWQVSRLLGLVVLVQNVLLWYPILLLSFYGIWKLFGTQTLSAMVLLAFTLVGTVLYGAVEGNIGPAMRHRAQFQFCFFVFAAIAMDTLIAIRPLENHRSLATG